jgi:hypothetical protein
MASLSYVTLDKTHFLARCANSIVEEKMMLSVLEAENAMDIMDLSFDPQAAIAASEKFRPVVQTRDESMMQRLMAAVMNKVQALRGLDESKIDSLLDSVLNIIESIPLVLQDLMHAETNSQVVGALLRAFKMLTSRSVLLSLVDISGKLFDYVQKLTMESVKGLVSHIQSGFEFAWVVKAARDVLRGYSTIKQSQCIRKLQTLLSYFLSFGF